MSIFFIGDPHFGHSNVIRHNNRPFRDVIEMNTKLKQNWNEVVSHTDTVYILGDFWYKGSGNAISFLRSLNGKKHLIVGNHDKTNLKNPDFIAEFESISDILDICIDNERIILCHYPMAEWNGYFRGSWHIHGHIHNKKNGVFNNFLKNEPRALNAGVDINGFKPVTFVELKENNKIFKLT